MTPALAPGLDEARVALARVDAACAEYGWTADDGMSSDHLRAALTVADRLAAENVRLREALNMEAMRAGPSDDWVASVDEDGIRVWTHAPTGHRIERDNEPEGWGRPADYRGDMLAIDVARRILAEVHDGR